LHSITLSVILRSVIYHDRASAALMRVHVEDERRRR